jgi:hypothetical protein
MHGSDQSFILTLIPYFSVNFAKSPLNVFTVMAVSRFFVRLGLAICGIALVQAAPSGTLINGNSDANAKALMAYLMRNYGSRTLSGQQDEEWTSWVTSNIGKTPAITGFDFMDYSPSRVAFGSSSTNVEQAINWANRGGIVTFCWHWVCNHPGLEGSLTDEFSGISTRRLQQCGPTLVFKFLHRSHKL